MYSKTASIVIGQHSELRHWKLVSVGILIVLVVASIAIDKNAYTNGQAVPFMWLNKELQFMPEAFWLNVTYLGDALILIPLLSFVWLIQPRCWAAMFGAIPFALIVSHLGKHFFSIPRPAAILDNNTFTIIGKTLTAHTSFPSGHTTTIFTALSAILFVLMRNNKTSPKIKFGLTVGLFILASVVAVSRVAVGAHWPADLVLGMVIGITAGLIGEYLTRKYTRWWMWWITKPSAQFCFLLLFNSLLLYCVMLFKVPALFVVSLSIGISLLVMGVLLSKTVTSK
ncbi:phosphatase PAP2 family protein [Alteromonas sp. D210916BOD_24]|uniref:phosphatase PAP2 family protein n=1 Tax=Alteromonas sp. D210916BOD_24 TaxID=3157618 RepID=UPI00399CAF9B